MKNNDELDFLGKNFDISIYEDMQYQFDKKLDEQKQYEFRLRVKKGRKQRRNKYCVNLLRLASSSIWVDTDYKNEKQYKIRKKSHPRRIP